MPNYVNRKINQSQLEKARELKSKGLSIAAIRRILHLNVSIETLWKAIRNPNYGSQAYSGNWRFTRQQIIQIRNLVKYSGYSKYSRGRYAFIKHIAAMFNTSASHIYNIITYRQWKEL
jgi:hypothetical protein